MKLQHKISSCHWNNGAGSVGGYFLTARIPRDTQRVTGGRRGAQFRLDEHLGLDLMGPSVQNVIQHERYVHSNQ